MASNPRPSDHAHWHTADVATVLDKLGSSSTGLAHDEAQRRHRAHGPNALPAPPRRSRLMAFLTQFHNALIYFLLAAAVLAAALGHLVDSGVILGVVLINAIVGVIQEGKAEEAMLALRAMLAPHARVVRGGTQDLVEVEALVPGDILVLEAGDRVPADVRLMTAHGLRVDEAMLTGESVAAEKHTASVAADAALGERHSMAWSGTLVAAGHATAIVVETGSRTQLGRINALLRDVDSLETPLVRQVNQFGRRFTVVALAAAVLLFVYAVNWRDYGWGDALLVVVALAVGLVPEGLPAVITITLALGVRRMAARHAIVRRLPAVETLGATSVICTDKTGTLTRNEMTVRHIVTADAHYLADGVGYAPTGALSTRDGQPLENQPANLAALLEVACACNDAHLANEDGAWRVYGDPMEGALLALAGKGGVGPGDLSPRQDAIPFDASHRFMATLHALPGGGALLRVKGAPEPLLALSRFQLGRDGALQPLEGEAWLARIASLAADGNRVLAFAQRVYATAPSGLVLKDVTDLTLLGMTGLIDPPREEVIAAIADCRSAGIAVKMITGDHAATAGAIAHQIGLAEAPQVCTGAQIDDTPDDALPALVRTTQVFARTSPEHKLRIVQALQQDGAVIAMTGDGVNDAPSLKQADVGIAMGRQGTEAARQAAELVLTDDNFASIVAAVHEGRTVYDNIRKVIAWTLPTNGGEFLAIVAALIAGTTLPMNTAQILWVNMILTITLGLVLAFEPPEPGVMGRPPRRPEAPLMSPFMLWRMVFVSGLFVLGALGMFEWALSRGHEVAGARTMVVNTMCVMEIFYLFSVRYLHMRSFTLVGARGTPAVLGAIGAVVLAQLAFTYAPWMQFLFDTRPLALVDLAGIAGVGVVLFLVLETEKALFRRWGCFAELRPR